MRKNCQNGLVFAGMAEVPAGKEFLGNTLQKNRNIVAGIPFCRNEKDSFQDSCDLGGSRKKEQKKECTT